jgi:hypothetical protein
VEEEAATGSERSPRGTREAILDGFVFWLRFMLASLAQLTLTVLTMRIFSEELFGRKVFYEVLEVENSLYDGSFCRMQWDKEEMVVVMTRKVSS